jgi:hypothetical protein
LNETRALDWLPDRSSGIGYLLESRQRVEAATAAYEAGTIAADRPLVAIVGISDVREGVRLDVLGPAMRQQWRFIGVAGAGAGFASVQEQASLLLDGQLRPDLVIIGVSPMQMIESVDFERGAAEVTKAGAGDLLGKAKSELRDALWFARRRSDLVGWLDRTLLEARSGFERMLGHQTTIDTRSPWRPMLRTLGAEHYPDDVVRRGLMVVESSGARDLKTFENSTAPFVEAGKLVRRFKAQGSQVIVIIMPRHPWLEAIMPPSVDEIIESRLRFESMDAALVVLDYSEAVAADGFVDLVHLNTPGGERFTKQLARDLLSIKVKGQRPAAVR